MRRRYNMIYIFFCLFANRNVLEPDLYMYVIDQDRGTKVRRE